MTHHDPLDRSGDEDGFETRFVRVDGEPVEMRYYRAVDPVGAVAYVGGVGGGWGSPARGLYPRLAGELLDRRISGLRVRFRDARQLAGCVEDLRSGVAFLEEEGLARLALVGHSAGGAVVVQVAVASALVRTVVALAPQSFGSEAAVDLAPRCSILLVHGLDDAVLPKRTSEFLYDIAGDPKRLELLRGAGHWLHEEADKVHQLVYDWIVGELARPASLDVGAR
jgi:pimeloyl-ACP methyl ester carboxylesterase